MKSLLLSLFSVSLFLIPLAGCQTDTPGATNTLGAYSTMVNDRPDRVATAAQKAAGDLGLLDIVGNSTKIDGHITAKNAHGEAVSIDVEQAGDNVSKVTIRIGVTGDDAVSKQLIDRIKSHLTWL